MPVGEVCERRGSGCRGGVWAGSAGWGETPGRVGEAINYVTAVGRGLQQGMVLHPPSCCPGCCRSCRVSWGGSQPWGPLQHRPGLPSPRPSSAHPAPCTCTRAAAPTVVVAVVPPCLPAGPCMRSHDAAGRAICTVIIRWHVLMRRLGTLPPPAPARCGVGVVWCGTPAPLRAPPTQGSERNRFNEHAALKPEDKLEVGGGWGGG